MGEWNQNELEEIMKKIENSADDLKVPESLEPENVKMRLEKYQKRRKFVMKKAVEVAAVAAFAVIIGGTGIYGRMASNSDSMGVSGADGSFQTDAKADDLEKSVSISKKKQVGNFKLAENYDEVCKSVMVRKDKENYYMDDLVDGAADISMKEPATNEMALREESSTGEAKLKNESVKNDIEDYSTTNTQVEGVDESDFIKNDGSYLYLQSEDAIHIVDIRKNKMKDVATVKPEMNTGDMISDIYLDNDELYVILQKREVELNEPEENERKVLYETAEDLDYYYPSGKMSMELLTYDISDRGNAKLLGTVKQDGSYYDSRKVGDYIYLFSQKWLNTAKNPVIDDVVPYVNGKMVESDCIYTQEDSSGEIIVSSVNVKEPDKTVDKMVLMSNYAQIYVSSNAIYLYKDVYQWNVNGGISTKSNEENSYTDIAKFTYLNGKMNGAAAGTVRGTIQDVFAISEDSNGILRVLTTEWGTESKNQLYLLDEDLNEKGSLKNIAVGEEIYAARYIGNIAYFITYHNTDPLFAVDISNPQKPKMLGNVKVSGFSDYLHPYGENLLLGIGYETDPKTSERLGVKLVMFDISNPTKLKVKDSVTIKGSYCNAASDYKCALVNQDKNLIGFEVSDWRDDLKMDYMLYSWNGRKFVKKLSVDLGSGEYDIREWMIRGLYAGNRFYVVNSEDGNFKIRSYDMKNDFKKIDKFTTR